MTDQLSLDLDPGLPRLPVSLRPMLARPAARPFDSAGHLFEPAWGGARALAFVEPDAEAPPERSPGVRLLDGRGRDIAPLVPEIGGLPGRLAARSAVVDGELVAVDRHGRCDQPALAARLGGAPGPALVYLVFDLLYLDGRPLLGLPLERRRGLLGRILRPGGPIVARPAVETDGLALHAAVVAQGLAGTVARDRRSPYLPGTRSRLWRFVPALVPGVVPALVPALVPGVGGEGALAPGEEEGDPRAADDSTTGTPILALIERLPFPAD